MNSCFLRKHGRISNERFPSTNLREINSDTRRSRRSHVVVTLDPNKFAEKKQKRFHIGDLHFFNVARHDQSSLVKSPRLYYDLTREKGGTRIPTDTKAFLYYFRPPEKPRVAGELRLRVASSDDPASFESGSDLLDLTGRPWSRPLYVVSKYYTPLGEILRDDRLVPDDLYAVLSTCDAKYPRHHTRFLYTLKDTFVLDFSITTERFTINTEQGMELLRLSGLFRDTRAKCHSPQPYTGSALARFDRSTLPEHKGRRTVVLRFLKIITPVKCVIPLYDGYIGQPEEGELHRRSPRNTKTVKLNQAAWSVNIDKPKGFAVMARSLRLLWDA